MLICNLLFLNEMTVFNSNTMRHELGNYSTSSVAVVNRHLASNRHPGGSATMGSSIKAGWMPRSTVLSRTMSLVWNNFLDRGHFWGGGAVLWVRAAYMSY